MKRVRYIHINNGVGSGNVGDELMAQEFWKLLPAGILLDVPVLPEASRYRGSYPKPHRYFEVASSALIVPDVAGLLVGDTPVAEFEGLGYPLGAIGPALSTFASRGLPVDAIAVGVDRLHTLEGRRLFATHYAAVRSWTVRSTGCREALLDLGVSADRIRVAADLAWLFVPSHETDQWAVDQWADLGIGTSRPLLVVNVVHHANSADQTQKQTIASALDQLAFDRGYQIAFLNNETRLGSGYDTGATEAVRSLMKQPSVEVPVAYYTPQEMVSLLRPAATVLTQRYHMAIQAILAQTIPVCLHRGQKLTGLAQEFNLLACSVDSDDIVAQVSRSSARRTERLGKLETTRKEHRQRAKTALSFFRDFAQPQLPSANRTARSKKNPGIVVIHLGGLGDLVLSASLLSALRRQYPKSTISLFCRAAFVGLTDLFPIRPDRVIPVSFDPHRFTGPDDEVRNALSELASQLNNLETDMVISAELEPSWLSWYLTSLWRAPVNLACTPLEPPRGLLPILLHEGHRELVPFSGPAHSSELAEGERYRALGRSAGVRDWVLHRWSLAPDLVVQGEELLASLGLRPGEYGVCFPLGAGSTLVKRWPADSFATALEVATDSFKLPILLTGERHEEEALEAHAKLIRERGGRVSVFAGRANQLPLLAALLRWARFFLGNDTGPAHLAQAYETPGVVIFGGGTWPHYRPWGKGTVGVVHPLNCFGCRWDCAFGRAICIDAVSTEGVVNALRQSSANPGAPASMVTLDQLPVEIQQIVGSASRIYKASQQDRLSRFHALVETQYASNNNQLQLVQITRELEQQKLAVVGLRERQASAMSIAPARSVNEIESELGRIEKRLTDSVGAAQALVRYGKCPDNEDLGSLGEVLTTRGQLEPLVLEGGVRGEAPIGPSPAALKEAVKAAEERLEIIQRLLPEINQLRAEADRRLDWLVEANRIMADQQVELNHLLNDCAGARAQNEWQSERLKEFESAAISRLRELEEANILLGLKDAATEMQRVELGSLRGKSVIQGRLLAELERAAQSRLEALGDAASDIAESRQAATDRLAAIVEANSQLAHEQEVPETLRQKIAQLRGELTLATQRLAVAEPAAAQRLAALADVNLLLAAERANAEVVRQETARLSSELTLATQRFAVAEPAAAERLAALKDANRLLAAEQATAEIVRQETARLSSELTLATQRLAVVEPAAAERLAALEDVNRLLAAEQANAEAARKEKALLSGDLTLATQRATVAEQAAQERLEALQEVSRMLSASNQANHEQFERLVLFESAAAERLAALDATTASLNRQAVANAALRSDLDKIAGDATHARALQTAEREHWRLAVEELRNDLARERTARLDAERQVAEAQLRTSQISSERDRYLRATQELQLSERALADQVLAIQTETLVQSNFRLLRRMF